MTQEHTRIAYLLLAALAVGALLGVLGARVVLVGSGLSLIPWAIAGPALGVCCRSGRETVGAGAVFGFALAFTFMTTGYDGSAALHTRLLPFAALGLVGAICGAVLTAVGHRLAARRRASSDA